MGAALTTYAEPLTLRHGEPALTDEEEACEGTLVQQHDPADSMLLLRENGRPHVA